MRAVPDPLENARLFLLKISGIVTSASLSWFHFSNGKMFSLAGMILLSMCFLSYFSMLKLTNRGRSELVIRIALSAMGVYLVVGSVVVSDLELWCRVLVSFLGIFMTLPLFIKCKKLFELAIRSF